MYYFSTYKFVFNEITHKFTTNVFIFVYEIAYFHTIIVGIPVVISIYDYNISVTIWLQIVFIWHVMCYCRYYYIFYIQYGYVFLFFFFFFFCLLVLWTNCKSLWATLCPSIQTIIWIIIIIIYILMLRFIRATKYEHRNDVIKFS